MTNIKYLKSFTLILAVLFTQTTVAFAAGSIVSVTEGTKSETGMNYVVQVRGEPTVYLKRTLHLDNGESRTIYGELVKFNSEGIGQVVFFVPYSVADKSCLNIGRKCAVTSVDFILHYGNTVFDTKTVSHPGVSEPVDGSGGGGDGPSPGDGSGGDGSDPGDGNTPGGDGSGGDPGDGTGGDNGGGGGDPDDGNNPGDGSGGGGCSACELLACPGWSDIADQFADKIGDKIPPPPNWEEVAGVFGDELIPRFEKALEDTLGHPPAPPEIPEPVVPTMDGSVVDLVRPKPTDSTPPAETYDFSTVPSVSINPDTTGGIDLRNADPTDSLPHESDDYMPIPGRETGGFKPQTKPIETPMPSNGGVATPPPDQMPTPGTSMSEIPVPEGKIETPPRPEMPMPG